MKMIHRLAIAALVIGALVGSSAVASAADCIPRTKPSLTGGTSMSQLEMLEDICNRQATVAPAAAGPVLNKTITAAGSTIAVTNTFQTVLTASTTRSGCTIMNRGSNAMKIYPAVFGGAGDTGSLDLAPGQTFQCGSNGLATGNAFSLTGTAADKYSTWVW